MQKKLKKSFYPWFWIALIVLCILLIFLVRSCHGNESYSPLEQDSACTEITEDMTQEEIKEALNQKVKESMMQITINPSPIFISGSAYGALLFTNEEENLYDQQLTITLDDTNEIIYQSGAVPVGCRIVKAQLKRALPAGSYPCTGTISSIDSQTGTIYGTVLVHMTIQVLT